MTTAPARSTTRSGALAGPPMEGPAHPHTLVFGGLLLLGARLGDLLGRRRVFVAGLVVFVTA